MGEQRQYEAMRSLPPWPRLDTNALSRLFRNTTTPYKHLFFLALLRLLKRPRFDWNPPLSLRDLLLSPTSFALDHFLPWSFVVHDRLWNLLPADPRANSAKGDHVPDRGYIEDFVRIQHAGLKASRASV